MSCNKWLADRSNPEYYCEQCLTMTIIPMERDGHTVCTSCGLVHSEFWFEAPFDTYCEPEPTTLADIVTNIADSEEIATLAMKTLRHSNLIDSKSYVVANAAVNYATKELGMKKKVGSLRERRIEQHFTQDADRLGSVIRAAAVIIRSLDLKNIDFDLLRRAGQDACLTMTRSSKFIAAVLLCSQNETDVIRIAKHVKFPSRVLRTEVSQLCSTN